MLKKCTARRFFTAPLVILLILLRESSVRGTSLLRHFFLRGSWLGTCTLKLEDSEPSNRVARLGAHHLVDIALEQDQQRYCLTCFLLNQLHVHYVLNAKFVQLEHLERLHQLLDADSTWVAGHRIHVLFVESDGA